MTAAFASGPFDGLIVRSLSRPAPSPACLLLARTSDCRPAILVSGNGDPALTKWSYGALEPIAQVGNLREVRDQLHRFAPVPRDVGLPPFVGGAIGFSTYDAGWQFAARPRPLRTELGGLPPAMWSIYDAIYARDEVAGSGWLIAQDSPEAEQRLNRLETALLTPAVTPIGGTSRPVTPEISARRHQERVAHVLDLIRSGEVYQVNLTYRRSAPYSGAPEASFLRLLRNPPPFAAFFDAGQGRAVVSASPECFLTFGGPCRTAAVYPIKGTRPRGGSVARDRALAHELLANRKESAEHVMIVDLLRNDLGRVASAGSVAVDGLAYLEQFAAVQHLTSRIRARLPPGVKLHDLFRALFPGGSITGAPKLRAMELIDELEDQPRGLYTGALGFIAPDETACFSVAIRTADFVDGRVRFGVGGGIVADSSPEQEWEETETKSRTLTRVLEGD